MENPKYKTQGFYRGLQLWYNCTNGHAYVMRIWKNFRGISYIEYDEHDKKISHTSHYYSVSSWDTHTAFAMLRAHFNLEKEKKMIEYYLIRNKKTGRYLLNSTALGIEVPANIFENNFLREAMFTYSEIQEYKQRMEKSFIPFDAENYEKVLLTISIEEKTYAL